VRHCRGSSLCCEYCRCYAATHGNWNRDRDEFLMLTSAPQNDCQFLSILDIGNEIFFVFVLLLMLWLLLLLWSFTVHLVCGDFVVFMF